MTTVTVYEKPSCTTCKKLLLLLKREGVDVERIDYHVTGLTEPELRGLIAKAGVAPHELLRRRGVQVEAQNLGPDTYPDELIALMVAHPQLVERPIVVRGDRALLARPIERVMELLDTPAD
jgi:arsenate reductase